MRPSLAFGLIAAGITAAPPALARSGSVTIEIPRVETRPYRNPYVAVWLEDENAAPVKMLAVFHDQSRIGARWLPELRSWWRAGGRSMSLPADGVSGATRAPGRHMVEVGGLDALAPGRYSVVVEAAREKGGRELLKVPFELKPGKVVAAKAAGQGELGQIAVSIRR